jgi:hypothetical protein
VAHDLDASLFFLGREVPIDGLDDWCIKNSADWSRYQSVSGICSAFNFNRDKFSVRSEVAMPDQRIKVSGP